MIPIERYRGLLLVAGGEQDRSWDSAGMSRAISLRRKEHGQQTVVLTCPDAGHALMGSPRGPADVSRGGTVQANAAAKKAVWGAALDLFRAAWTARRQ